MGLTELTIHIHGPGLSNPWPTRLQEPKDSYGCGLLFVDIVTLQCQNVVDPRHIFDCTC